MALGTGTHTFQARQRYKATVLVIEDEGAIAELIEEGLTHAGYKIVLAGSGLEGLARIQDVEPEVIICDRVMPSMSGSELLERLRNLYPQYRDVPFIFLTALTDVRDKLAVEHLKPFAYMEKPLNFDLLERTIARALKPSESRQ
ncbi:MAG: putative two-component system response regulator transcriptional regulatory protein [Micavibrio sp.]|nr:putative two-component system response regulator transcriptional regulatory protein [Micavibrio sp.]